MGLSGFLLDTNVVSEPLRPRPDPELLRRLEENQDVVAIAAPAWHELVYGCRRLPSSRKRDAIEAYLFDTVLPSFEILAYGGRAARWHAEERARLEKSGRTPPYLDGQIAAVAAVRGLTLVTANVSDFQHFEGLDVVSWLSEGWTG